MKLCGSNSFERLRKFRSCSSNHYFYPSGSMSFISAIKERKPHRFIYEYLETNEEDGSVKTKQQQISFSVSTNDPEAQRDKRTWALKVLEILRGHCVQGKNHDELQSLKVDLLATWPNRVQEITSMHQNFPWDEVESSPKVRGSVARRGGDPLGEARSSMGEASSSSRGPAADSNNQEPAPTASAPSSSSKGEKGHPIKLAEEDVLDSSSDKLIEDRKGKRKLEKTERMESARKQRTSNEGRKTEVELAAPKGLRMSIWEDSIQDMENLWVEHGIESIVKLYNAQAIQGADLAKQDLELALLPLRTERMEKDDNYACLLHRFRRTARSETIKELGSNLRPLLSRFQDLASMYSLKLAKAFKLKVEPFNEKKYMGTWETWCPSPRLLYCDPEVRVFQKPSLWQTKAATGSEGEPYDLGAWIEGKFGDACIATLDQRQRGHCTMCHVLGKGQSGCVPVASPFCNPDNLKLTKVFLVVIEGELPFEYKHMCGKGKTSRGEDGTATVWTTCNEGDANCISSHVRTLATLRLAGADFTLVTISTESVMNEEELMAQVKWLSVNFARFRGKNNEVLDNFCDWARSEDFVSSKFVHCSSVSFQVFGEPQEKLCDKVMSVFCPLEPTSMFAVLIQASEVKLSERPFYLGPLGAEESLMKKALKSLGLQDLLAEELLEKLASSQEALQSLLLEANTCFRQEQLEYLVKDRLLISWDINSTISEFIRTSDLPKKVRYNVICQLMSI